MSKTHSGPKKVHRTGRTDSQTVPEQSWDHDWRNYDPGHEPGDDVPDMLLRKRKKRRLAHQRNISYHEADMLIRYGDVEIGDAEVVD